MRSVALSLFSVLGVLLTLLVGLPSAASSPALPTGVNLDDGFVPLFNGSNLAGWTTSGNGDAWKAESGEIVGGANGAGDGWWLRTEKQYRDFDLRLEFKIPKDGNSGVGLRGSAHGDPAFTGMELQVYDNHGQAPSINGCGAVYNAIVPTAQPVKAPGEWNAYRILLVSDTLNVWLNDVQIHKDQKLDDRGYFRELDQKMPLNARLTTGFIALQDHGNPVRFRNLRIKDLSPDPDSGGYTMLCNGKDLRGWTPHWEKEGTWLVEDGAIVGRNGPGHLFHEAVHGDVELRAHVKINPKGNSGLYFRTVPRPDNPNSWPLGYEAQVDNHDPKNFTGCIYDRAWAKAKVTRDEAWLDYRIRAIGNHIQTWINGVPMVDAHLKDFATGHVALQTHHNGNEVMYKDVRVRDLGTKPAGGSAPASQVRGTDRPVRVFYCTHSAGFRHEVLPMTREIMTRLGHELPWLEVYVSDAIGDLTPDRLSQTDVVMLFTTGALPMGEMKRRLLDWVAAGGSLVGVHSATDTFAESPEYVQTIGGTFDGHPWNQTVSIVVNDESHPAMKPFLASESAGSGPRKFEIADEIYQFREVNPAMHVLMSLAPESPGYDVKRKYPLAWTLEIGKGRVFYTALGHRPEVWQDRRFVDHVLAGIKWAGGDR